MGFRIQKSFRIAKGVRLNMSKSGLGVSVGVPGARYSVHSSGRRTGTVGVPGSGVRYQVTKSGGRTRARAAAGSSPEPPSRPVMVAKPGFLAPKGEKALHKAIASNDPAAIAAVGQEFPDYRTVAFSVAGFLSIGMDRPRARQLLAGVFAGGADPSRDGFFQKYIGGSNVGVPIARGVDAFLPLDRDSLGLMLAELHQDAGDLEAAIDTVEQLEPSTYAAVSLAELYGLTGRHQDIVDLTEHVTNEDDASALLCVFRGEALHELGFHDAALAAFKEALRSKSRSVEIRHLALSERARTHEARGKNAMARKDLERIMAEDSTYEGLSERIAALPSAQVPKKSGSESSRCPQGHPVSSGSKFCPECGSPIR
jgi:hypothetical protein